MILYALPISNYCSKVRIVLRYKGIPHEVVPPPDGYGSDAYKQAVPSGKIPGLVDGTLALSESETINEYLEERFPEPALLPEDVAQRARVRQLSRHHDLAVEPVIRSLFREVAPATRRPEVIDEKAQELDRQLQLLATLASPQPFLLTPTLSLADVGYAPTLLLGRLMWQAFGREWRLPEPLQPWMEVLTAVPAVAETLAEAEAATEAWIASKHTPTAR